MPPGPSEGREEFGDGAVERGDAEVGGYGGEGFEDEAALVEAGVREGEGFGGDDVVGVEEEVEVEGAGGPGVGRFLGAVAVAGTLDCVEFAEERVGVESGFDERGGVQVWPAGVGG